MMSATGVLSPTTSLEVSWGRAANSLNYDCSRTSCTASNPGASALPLLFPDAVQGDYMPGFQFRGGRTATPASTRPTAVRSPTRTSPTTSSPT